MNWPQLLGSQRLGSPSGSSEPSRSPFEQDFDRIIFSHPFRRLQDKTQVHPLPEHDFVHNRLTHSLEVSSVGRSLGRMAGDVILERHPELVGHSAADLGTIVASASLAHDLGNPPFGHSGEEALSDYFVHREGKRYQDMLSPAQWRDLLQFEGNAQGFRILNKAAYAGLKLTVATLGAFTKYPCPSHLLRDKQRKSQKKFGFFQTEAPLFERVAIQLGLPPAGEHAWLRHPLAFLVEAADDICYHIIDLEDGCRLGLVSERDTIDLLAPILGTAYKPEKAAAIRSSNERIGVLRALAIRHLVRDTVDVFLAHETEMLSGTFDRALTEEGRFREPLRDIIKLSIDKIYRARHVIEIETTGLEVLPGLLGEFLEAAEHLAGRTTGRKHINVARMLPPESIAAIEAEPQNTYLRIREVIDFVSGLTDRHALTLYRKLKGISL